MNKRMGLSLLVFFAVAVFFAILSWIAGFNFNERGPGVALGVYFSALFSAIAGGLTYFSKGKL